MSIPSFKFPGQSRLREVNGTESHEAPCDGAWVVPTKKVLGTVPRYAGCPTQQRTLPVLSGAETRQHKGPEIFGVTPDFQAVDILL